MLTFLAAMALAAEPDISAEQAWTRVYHQGRAVAITGAALPAAIPIAWYWAEHAPMRCDGDFCSPTAPTGAVALAVGSGIASVPLLAYGTARQCRALEILDHRARRCPGPIVAAVAAPVTAVGFVWAVAAQNGTPLVLMAAWPAAWLVGVVQLIDNERRWSAGAALAVVPLAGKAPGVALAGSW
jgi:hypothetical protein